ncbi:relaxase/mobilization nuclease domain-containing protein [Chryseobacterium cucumeris]|uniref:relaxase/mobilization nuclease domain-containing protein n=1 Tax=Chryseobacterium cucumeris TaxID=1813611 RepID=UPI001F4B25A6|nr:relaxase/mobilization nuclease domain-containing protein [Chryseobacterium cucumeris]
MIGLAESCIGGFALFNYVIDLNKGYELMRNNLCGESPLEIMQELKIIQNLNQKATNKLFSMVLSPHINDGENLSKKQLRELTKDFLQELEIDPEKAQFIGFVHTEKKHRHIHILMNRVSTNAKLFADHHIGKKAQWAAHRVAEKHQLISARQIRLNNMKEAETIKADSKQICKKIYQKHNNVILTKPKSMEEYLSKMLKMGMDFIPTITKQGSLQGFRIKDLESQQDIKASAVHRSMGLKSLLESGMPFENPNIILHDSLIESQELANLQKISGDNALKEKITHEAKNPINSYENQSNTEEITKKHSVNSSVHEEQNDASKQKFKRR